MATHPFYPLGVAIPNYSANTMSTPVILAWFCGIGATIILPTLAIAKSKRPGIPKSELATAAWFVLCAFIHFFLEGKSHPPPCSFNPTDLAQATSRCTSTPSRAT
jgi:cholestenol delta-isomerase